MGSGKIKYMDVVCPFFVKWTTTSVTCEGIIPGSRCTTQTFKNWLEMEKFVRLNCCSFSPDCEIYRLLNLKYDK